MSLVLYRKYRPQSFEQLHGQEHVKAILKQALEDNEVAHAYLFAGPRGTGKTSAARILASKLGVKGIDLVEIDAASHRGIDDIRELREAVSFHPTQGKNKLFVLDEAHMLTNEAFNALLKTLEEPPSHVYFVLCTTEPHKIPLTVTSRCQRLNFQQATNAQISSLLKSIAAKENFAVQEEVLELIALHADGSFRDAIVIMEQAMGHNTERELRPEVLKDRLGLISGSQVSEVHNLIAQKGPDALLAKISELVESGVSIPHVTDKLVEHTTNLLTNSEKINNQESGLTRTELIKLLEGLTTARSKMRQIKKQQVPLIVELMKWLDDQREEPSPRPTKTKEPKTPAKTSPALQDSPITPDNNNPKPESTDSTTEIWPQIMREVKRRKSTVEALLKGGTPKGVDPSGNFVVEFSYNFHKQKMEERENREVLEKVLEKFLGQNLRVRCVISRGDNKEQKHDHSQDQPINLEDFEGVQDKRAEKETSASQTKKEDPPFRPTTATKTSLEKAVQTLGGNIITS